ncbi:glycosyltransferase family 4 protein [Vibrio splendidus]|uniref:glycosyltransferase family 4 protein n=1 Tax=Vibrio splendidus TaxID=29497 RepID=UPI000D340945|nr:glycosyltransferase family 4 protein [Vibrio splendidus]PTP29382.1 hypothetical protein CWN92_11750 [Vibrio splendidus]
MSTVNNKIAYLIPTLEVGGAEVAAVHIAKYSKKFDVDVYPFLKVDRKFVDSFNILDKVHFKYKFLIFQFFYVILSIVKSKPKYVVVSLWKSVPLALLCLFFSLGKIKIVTMIHSDSFFSYLDRFFLKLSCHFSKLVIADSNSSANFIKKNISKPHLVLPIRFLLRRLVVKEIDHSSFMWRFVFIGRVTKVKRLDISLEILFLLKGLGVNSTLDIYGTTPDLEHFVYLKKRIQELNLEKHVRFLGVIDNNLVPDILNNYDAYLCFSDKEGMAISVYEAQQAGLLVFCKSIGELRFYCENNVNAFVIEDNESLYSFLSRVENIISNKEKFDEFYKKFHSSINNEPLFLDSFERVL